jgi:hypothetical protein
MQELGRARRGRGWGDCEYAIQLGILKASYFFRADFFDFAFAGFGGALEHAMDQQLDAFVAGAGLFCGVDEDDQLTAEGYRLRAEGSESTRCGGQGRGEIGREDGSARRGVDEERDLDGVAGVDTKLAPDAAVHVKTIAATAGRRERAGEWQAFDPTVDGNVGNIGDRGGAKRFGNVAGKIDAAHDPDFVDGRDEDVGVVVRIHDAARIAGSEAVEKEKRGLVGDVVGGREPLLGAGGALQFADRKKDQGEQQRGEDSHLRSFS